MVAVSLPGSDSAGEGLAALAGGGQLKAPVEGLSPWPTSLKASLCHQIVSSKKITRPLLLMNDKPAGKGLITVPAPSALHVPTPATAPLLPSPINGPLLRQIITSFVWSKKAQLTT